MPRPLIYIVVFSLLSACTTLNPDYEEPTVMMTAFRAVPAEGAMPGFEVGLRIINPNPTPLDLQGVVYSISLQGHELVKGVGKDYPQIEGYSEGNITLNASANLLRGIQFLAGMAKSPDKQLEYEFEAKLDVGGFLPSLRVSETGMFNLGNE
jgi:LEA14-like dessication related protein